MFAADELIQEKVTSKFQKVSMPFESPTNQMKFEEIYPEEENMAGGIFTGSSTSRARLFSQQRELMTKKRLSQLQNDGMVRRSTASNFSDEQYTPAARQFSAPKNFSTDSNEFSKTNPMRAKGKSFSHSDEDFKLTENEEEDIENHPNGIRQTRKPSYKIAKPLSQERYMDEQTSRATSSGREEVAELGVDDTDIIDLYAEEARRKKGQTPRSTQKKQRRHRRNLSHQSAQFSEPDRSSADEAAVAAGPKQKSNRRTPKKQHNNNHRTPKKHHQDNNGNKDEVDLNESMTRSTKKMIPRPMVLDLSNMKAFLTSPVPKHAGVVQCYIKRNTAGTNRLYPKYSLYLKDGDVFLMSSKKRPNNKTSNYLISMDAQDLHRQSASYLGKVRSNFLGTEYQIFDDGVNPKDRIDGEEKAGMAPVRQELAAVTYAATFTTSAPRKMQALIPALDPATGQAIAWKDGRGPNGEDDDLITRIKSRSFTAEECSYYMNKPPRWNDQIGGYVLNFHGRVTMASVKNFQLVNPDDQQTVVLQFGKVGKEDFTMDVQHPMTLFQAFAIALTSFDSKIACD